MVAGVFAGLRRAYDGLVTLLGAAAAAICVGLSLWVTYDVMLRYFFKLPTSWASDLSEYALLWIAFLAGPWLVRQKGHVSVDLLVENVAPSARRAFAKLAAIIASATCFILAWQSGETVIDYYARGMTFAKEWDLPRYVPYLIIPIGSFLMGVEFLRQAAWGRGGAARTPGAVEAMH